MYPFNEPKNRKNSVPCVPHKDKDGNVIGQFVIDQFSGKDFCIGEFGFPLSDIALIEKAQTQKEFELLASRLQEIDMPSVDTSKISDKQKILDCMPAWIQTPSEIEKFADYYNDIHPVDDKLDSGEVSQGNVKSLDNEEAISVDSAES